MVLVVGIFNSNCGNNIENCLHSLSENAFVCLLREDNKEFVCFFGDLYKITERDFRDNSIGQKERIDILNRCRKVNFAEFKILETMGNIHIVTGGNEINLDVFSNSFIYGKKNIEFMKIPEDRKGLVVKHLWCKGYYIIFKEYRGEYSLVPLCGNEKKVKKHLFHVF
jgi:hypothetical protein